MATTGTVWQPRVNNPFYRIRGLTLPPHASTGPMRLNFRTTLVPDRTGWIRVKILSVERDIEARAGEGFDIEGGVDVEISNSDDQELSLTVIELK